MTRARTRVLGLLEAASEPLTAAGVATRLDGCCDQATVYRALHFLEEQRLAESFVLYCSEHGVERYYSAAATAHRHWFHCERCHRFVDLGACRLGGLVADVEHDLGLRVTRHTLYLSGICADCAGHASPELKADGVDGVDGADGPTGP